MANKLSAASDSEATAAEANRTVFIDTSLDTHLAMVLADSYTVSDFKRKIEKEHTLCFTNIGNIVVHALKVKRKGHLYHLSDSMFVKDAFDGASKNWFLSVDASIVEGKHDEKRLVHNPDSHNLLTCYGLLCNASANGVDLSLDGSPNQGTSDPNNAASPQKHVERKSDVSNRGILEKCDKSVEEASQSNHAANRKRKFDEVRNEHLQGYNIDTIKDISKREITSQHALGDEEKSKNAALDDLTSIPVNDDHPVMNNSSIEKKKRIKKSKSRLGQVAAVDPSAGRDFLEESYMVTTGIDLKGSGGEPNTKSFAEEGENGIKHSDTIQETGEHVPSAEVHEADAHEEDASSLATKMGNSKDHYPVEMESNPPLVMEKHVDLPIDIGVSGQENIGSGRAERAKEQGALSKKKGSRKMQSKRHDDLPLDIGVSGKENIRSDQDERTEVQEVLTKNPRSRKTQLKKDDNLPMGTGVSGQENIISDQAIRAEEQGAFSKNKGSEKTRSKKNDIEVGVSRQGALSKKKGSHKMQSKRHDDLPLDIGVSGQENIRSDEAERTEVQEVLTKNKRSRKTQLKKDDNLPMSTGVSGQENIISDQAVKAEEQGAFSKNKGSQKTQSKQNDIEVGVSRQENIVGDQAERAEEQGALSKRKDDNLPMDIEVSGQENIISYQAERAEEQGAFSKNKGSQKPWSKENDNRPIEVGVSGQENIVSDQADRAEEQGALSKRKDDNLPMDIEVSGQENIISYQAERAEEQGAFSKNKGSQKPWSKENDNRPIEVGVSGQENIVSDQAERAEEQGALSKRKVTLKTQSKKHDNLSLNIGVSGQEKVRSGQAEIAEEQGTLTNRENSLKMQPKKRDSRRQEETEVETKDVNAAADLLDENWTVEPTNSRKKRKGSKNTKDLIAKVVTSLGREDIEGSETNISTKPFEPLGDKARNEETNLSQTNRKEELRSSAESTFLAKENCDVTGTEVNTVQQTSGYQAENVEEQVGKTPKKKQKSSVKNPPVLQSEAGSVVHQISPAPVDKTQVIGSSKSKAKGKLKKTAVEDRLNEEKMESESRGEKELVPTQRAQSNSVVAKSTKVQSNSIDPKYKENAGEADPSDGANKDIEISVVGSEKPLPDTSSGGLVDKKTGANKDAKTPKSKKKIENPDTYSDKISSAFQSSQKANRKQGIEKKAPAGKSSTTPLQSLSKDNPDESAVQPTEKLQKASKTEAKAPPTDVSGKLNSTRKETKMQHAVDVSGTNIQSEKSNGLASVSNTPMESSRNIISKDVGSNKHQPGMHSYRAANIKAAVKGDGKIVNSLEPTKKLRATPGTIFRDDDSGESSEDDEGTDDSDASTRTPSDYSQSSDYSDGESNANFNSPERGSYASNRMRSGGRSTIKSCSSSAKNMTFDSILKSSSRFKRAKETASQLRLEDESQPDEFVPDSLPIE